MTKLCNNDDVVERKSGGSRMMLNTDQVALVLGVCPQTVRNWIKKGKVEAVQMCPRGKFLIKSDHVLKMIDAP